MEARSVTGEDNHSIIDDEIHKTRRSIRNLQACSRINPKKYQTKQEEEKKLDFLEQLKRRNILRFVGLKEEENEDIRTVVIELIKTRLELTLEEEAVSFVSREGNPRPDGRPRHVVVHFQDTRTKNVVYKKKKMLKGSKVVIKEDLTPLRVQLLKKTSSKYGNRNVWTHNGHIFAKCGKEIIEIV